MKKLFLLIVLFVAAAFSSCKYDDGEIWAASAGLKTAWPSWRNSASR